MRLVVARSVGVPAADAWASLTAWEEQGAWMPMTTVRVASPGRDGAGTRVEAWTGMRRLGFLDTMTVTAWQPPHRCEVLHTGRILRGRGVFVVQEVTAQQCHVTWEEDLEPPGGRAGRILAEVARPLAVVGLAWALRRFSRYATRTRRGDR